MYTMALSGTLLLVLAFLGGCHGMSVKHPSFVQSHYDEMGCLNGYPILKETPNDSLALQTLTCHKNAPCPEQAYCSFNMMDMPSICCPTYPEPFIKPGSCPVNYTSDGDCNNLDECKSDGDCGLEFLNEYKCCSTQCGLKCLLSQPQPSINPCDEMECPYHEMCHVFQQCDDEQDTSCTLVARCVDHGMGCRNGQPILKGTPNEPLALQPRTCHKNAPCPEQAYCSFEMMDMPSICCLTDPEPIIKPGSCPVNYTFDGDCNNLDECKSDGDCGLEIDIKCCTTQCGLKCLPSQHQPSINPCDEMEGECNYDEKCRVVKKCHDEQDTDCTLEARCVSAKETPLDEEGDWSWTNIEEGDGIDDLKPQVFPPHHEEEEDDEDDGVIPNLLPEYLPIMEKYEGNLWKENEHLLKMLKDKVVGHPPPPKPTSLPPPTTQPPRNQPPTTQPPNTKPPSTEPIMME